MKSVIAAAALAALLSGCASIVGSQTQTIPISSTPSDASVKITDEAGLEVFAGNTPTSVTLNKSTGRYFGGKSFKVVIAKDGFKTQTIPVESRPNGWYIGGNFVFGGLIGWLAVDPLNGGMYTLSPEALTASMAGEKLAHNNKSTDGSISIMLLQDVPSEMQGKLVRLN
jgi:ABC-type Fe3+-hydroxamate transport system substrate-binding protein